jgi:O-antigen/teichoic acid export membrane protein
MLLVPGPVAALFFGSRDAVGLARALAGFVFVTACFQVLYAVFRGHLRIMRANLLELLVVGAIPVAVAVFGPTDLVSFMWIINGAIAVATLTTARPLAATLSPLSRLMPAVLHEGRELLRFGLARTPGDVAVVALFSLAPLAVVHYHGATEAGYTSIVQSSINLIGVAAVPLGVLLLPRVALDLAHADPGVAQRYLLLAQATLDTSIGGAALLFAGAPLVIAFWLPSVPPEAVTGLEIVALGLPGYVFYLVFRSYLDAVHVRPLSSVPTIMGLGALGLLLVPLLRMNTFEPVIAASLALTIALSVTGGLTLLFVNRHLRGLLRPKQHGLAFAGGLVMVLTGLIVRHESWAVVGAASLLSAGVYCALLFVSRPDWLNALLLRVLAR